MIVSAVALLAFVLPSVSADTDFTLDWSSGEMSRDASSSKVTWTLAGDSMTMSSTSSGRLAGPEDRDTAKRFTVSAADLPRIAEALAAAEKAFPKPWPPPKLVEGRYTEVTLKHGKRTIHVSLRYDLDDTIHRPKEPAARQEALEKLLALRDLMFQLLVAAPQ